MKYVWGKLIQVSALALAFAFTGCATGGHNERILNLTGFSAEEISVSQKSNFHQIQLSAVGGEVTELEDGSTVVKFDSVDYSQFNPAWSTDMRLKGYRRVLDRVEVAALELVIEPVGEGLTRARGDAPFLPAVIEEGVDE